MQCKLEAGTLCSQREKKRHVFQKQALVKEKVKSMSMPVLRGSAGNKNVLGEIPFLAEQLNVANKIFFLGHLLLICSIYLDLTEMNRQNDYRSLKERIFCKFSSVVFKQIS